MKRIFLLVLACLFCSPLLAEDWVSLFHRTGELFQRMAITKNNDDPATWQEYSSVAQRLAQENSTSVQKEVAELADVYEKNPDIRPVLIHLLSNVGQLRLDTAEAFKPIATLITHLYDDTETRRGAMRVFVDVPESAIGVIGTYSGFLSSRGRRWSFPAFSKVLSSIQRSDVCITTRRHRTNRP